MSAREAAIRDIAEALDRVPVGDYPWHHEAPHHPEYAEALYDAGLRPAADRDRLRAAIIEGIRENSYEILRDLLAAYDRTWTERS